MRARRCSALVCVSVVVAAACRPVAAPPSPATPADACAIGHPATSTDTIRVGLAGPVDGRHAPLPTSDAERLVFRQLYEGLVRVDCAGRVRPGLAAAWRSSGDTVWTFELDPGTRFWDGTPIDGGTIADGWRRSPFLPVREVRSGREGTLTVVLDAPRPVEAFGDPAWSIVKLIPESPWPLGTGAWWVRGWEWTGRDSVLVASRTPTASPATPVLAFTRAPDVDPRDLLDGRVEALLTRDPDVRSYALARDGWDAVPLAWDRLYVLLSPERERGGTRTQLAPDARAALARDAVRADARPADLPGTSVWWSGIACGAVARDSARGAGPIVDPASVAFPASDPAAGDLAGRLVARANEELRTLLGTPVRRAPRAIPLKESDERLRLARGAVLAFVVALPVRPLDPCRAITRLTTTIPWLADATGAIPADAPALLVETRAHLLLRPGLSGSVEADGGVRFTPPPRP